jgi:hypothetical protein
MLGLDGDSDPVKRHGLVSVFPVAIGRRCRAECACGFSSPAFSTAGLAESFVDAHASCERARSLQVDAALLQLESKALTVIDGRNRAWSLAVAKRIRRQRLSVHPAVPREPLTLQPTSTVLADADVQLGALLAEHLQNAGDFEIVGRGSSGIDAVALTVLEQPRLLIIDDEMPDMSGVAAVSLLRTLDVGAATRICLYGDHPPESSPADLTISKREPWSVLSKHLMDLVA